MTRLRRRGGRLLSTTVIVLAMTVGWWSYRGLASPTERPPLRTTTSTSSTSTIPPDVEHLALYVDEHFSEAPWYESIQGYEQMGSEGVVVLTSLTTTTFTDAAVGICRAVSFWRPGDDLRIVVRARGGETIAESLRGSGAESCEPVKDAPP